MHDLPLTLTTSFLCLNLIKRQVLSHHNTDLFQQWFETVLEGTDKCLIVLLIEVLCCSGWLLNFVLDMDTFVLVVIEHQKFKRLSLAFEDQKLKDVWFNHMHFYPILITLKLPRNRFGQYIWAPVDYMRQMS